MVKTGIDDAHPTLQRPAGHFIAAHYSGSRWVDVHGLVSFIFPLGLANEPAGLACPASSKTEELCTSLNVQVIELRERSGRVTVMGKGNKKRTVPLNAEARAALSAWLKVRPETESAALFIGRRGERLGTRAVQRVVARQRSPAGLENLTPHVLRHTFAKNLVDAGAGLEQVADLLGHSRLETTRIYTRPGRRDLERAVEAIVVR
ncbi:MAG TPA: hypothetical protein ENL34_06760 [Chloroflexi bacterium]|nr:hypothetical protein [Chloroflexota bacterium]